MVFVFTITPVFEALLRLFSAEHCDGVQFLEGHVTHARSMEAKHSFRYAVRGWAMGMGMG